MNKSYSLFTIFLILFFSVSTLAQTAWHVDTTTTVSSDGQYWASALNDLQDALDSASAGDSILVSKGIYLPDRGTGSRDSTFIMRDSVVILGGFSVADGDTSINSRDWETHVTVLSGEIQDDGDSTNNTYVIITNNNNGIDDAAILDGFTITGAHNTNTSGGVTLGGGMYNEIVSPTVRNCIFTLNTIDASDGIAAGAGICNRNHGVAMEITNCTFSYNVVYSNQDALFLGEARGGGLYNNGSTTAPDVTSCTFNANGCEGNFRTQGGAVYNEQSSKPVFVDCIFSNNTCTASSGSSSWANGAAIFNGTSARSTTTNCLFFNNATSAPGINSFGNGGAVCNFNGGIVAVNNCTFSNNSASGISADGGAIWNFGGGSTLNLVNSILYGNTATGSGSNYYHNLGTGNISYSDIEGCGGSGSWGSNCGTDNGNNIDSDPFFVDDTNDDYQLDTCSPAVNTGSTNGIPSGITTDLNGDDRIQADSVDMGAYEQAPSQSCIYTWDGSTDTDWGTAANWNRNAVPPAYSSINIPDVTNDPVLDTTRIIGTLTIETNGQLSMGRNRLNIYGNVDNSGTVVNDTSSMAFKSDDAQTIAGDITVDTLIADGTGGVTISSGTTQIAAELELLQGAFNTGGNLTLLSDADGTARIAEIVSGATITGNVTAQQFIDGTNQDWRLLSSPVSGQTIASWDDDIITTGFTGSDFPSFGWVNIYSYDETVTGTYDNGYNGASNVTDAIGTGEGFMVYLGGSNATVDVTGPTHVGNININLDFTSTPLATDDGWNLIGNPMPSAVDFGLLNVTNANNNYYVYDPATGNYATWDEDLGTGTLGTDGNIAQNQGFWVQTTNTGASITFSESSKVTAATEFFSKMSKPYLTISLKDGAKRMDETIIRTDALGENSYGLHDTRKLYNSDPNLLAIATVSTDTTELAINSIAESMENLLIPITLHGDSGATCTLDFAGTAHLGSNYCMVLEDIHNNKVYDLSGDTAYNFTIPQNGPNEFLQIRITAQPAIELLVNGEETPVAEEVFICDGDDVTLTATGEASSNFSWNHSVNNGTSFLPETGSKTYVVSESNANTGCMLDNEITITVDELPEPVIERTEDVLKTGTFKAYQWYLNEEPIAGAINQEYTFSETGLYQVDVWNDHDCQGTSAVFDLATGNQTVADVTGVAQQVYPNPGSDFLNVRFNLDGQGARLEVNDILGKKVVDETIKTGISGQVNRNYDLSDQPAGIYFVTIVTSNDQSTVKWIKK